MLLLKLALNFLTAKYVGCNYSVAKQMPCPIKNDSNSKWTFFQRAPVLKQKKNT